jgi:hypothetical protein
MVATRMGLLVADLRCALDHRRSSSPGVVERAIGA